jgi:hypothetical protein
MHSFLHISDKQGDMTGQQVKGNASNIDEVPDRTIQNPQRPKTEQFMAV